MFDHSKSEPEKREGDDSASQEASIRIQVQSPNVDEPLGDVQMTEVKPWDTDTVQHCYDGAEYEQALFPVRAV